MGDFLEGAYNSSGSQEDFAISFTRITVDPKQMGGAPCIRGLRIPVVTLIGVVADRMTEEEILEMFPT